MNPILAVIVIYIIFICIAYFILNNFWKAFFSTGVIFAILGIVLGIFLFLDAQDIQENFQTKEKIIILEHNKMVSAGFRSGREAVSIDARILANYSEALKNSEHDQIIGEDYRIIIYSLSLIEELDNFSITILETEFDKQEIVKIMRNEGKADYWAQKLFVEDYHQLRNIIFSELMNQKLSGPENTEVFIKGLKSGEIKIYPETMVFKTIKFLPGSWIEERIKDMG